jgi:hypothetical protein
MGSALNLRLDLQLVGSGTLSLMVDPVSAELFLDGKSLAVGPVEVEDVSQGEHIVGAFLDGYAPLEQQVIVRSGQVTRMDLNLQPRGSETASPAVETEAEARSEDKSEEKKEKKEKEKEKKEKEKEKKDASAQTEESTAPPEPAPPKAKKSGRGKKLVLGGASAIAVGVGSGFVFTAYRNYTNHYVPGITACSANNGNCQSTWDDYHRDGIRRYQYIGTGLIGLGAAGLGTTGLLVIVTEDGTPVVGLTRRW